MVKKNSNKRASKEKQEAKKRFKYKFTKYSKKSKNQTAKEKKQGKPPKKNESLENKNISTKETLKANTKYMMPNLVENIKNEIIEKALKVHYETYSENYFYKSLERLNQDKKVVTEEILNKYGMTEERRKYVLSYFLLFIDEHRINSKLYFLTVSLFDLFLINYSESNDENKCRNLFVSKNINQFSDTKLILLIFCCYYIIAKYCNTNLLTIDNLLEYENAKKEVTYDDLFNLIRDIIIYTNCNINILNIYSFIEIYLFQIKECMKNNKFENYQKFIESLEKIVSFFGAKISRKIVMLSIEESFQALGLLIFCYQLCKYNFEVSSNLDKNVHNILINLKECLMNYYGANKLPIIIDWLNHNWNK